MYDAAKHSASQGIDAAKHAAGQADDSGRRLRPTTPSPILVSGVSAVRQLMGQRNRTRLRAPRCIFRLPTLPRRLSPLTMGLGPMRSVRLTPMDTASPRYRPQIRPCLRASVRTHRRTQATRMSRRQCATPNAMASPMPARSTVWQWLATPCGWRAPLPVCAPPRIYRSSQHRCMTRCSERRRSISSGRSTWRWMHSNAIRIRMVPAPAARRQWSSRLGTVDAAGHCNLRLQVGVL